MAEKMKETTEHYAHEVRDATERWWGATRRTARAAGHGAAEYRRRVQKKMDLASVQKKIETRCTELGKEVFQAWQEGDVNPVNRDEVHRLLVELEGLQARTETLTQEIARHRAAREEETGTERENYQI